MGTGKKVCTIFFSTLNPSETSATISSSSMMQPETWLNPLPNIHNFFFAAASQKHARNEKKKTISE